MRQKLFDSVAESVGSITNRHWSSDRGQEWSVGGIVSTAEDLCWLSAVCHTECRLPLVSGTFLCFMLF